MALLATQSISLAGVQEAMAAAAGGGDTFTPSRRAYLRVNNGGGSPITVTIVTPATSRGLAVADVAVSVTNGTAKDFGPLNPDLFADPTTGLGSITYSGVTTVTVGIFELSEV